MFRATAYLEVSKASGHGRARKPAHQQTPQRPWTGSLPSFRPQSCSSWLWVWGSERHCLVIPSGQFLSSRSSVPAVPLAIRVLL